MRRLLALVLLIVFASLNAMDGICCPDGCTQQEQASSSQPHDRESSEGVCLLCLGGIDAAAPPAPAPVGAVAHRAAWPPTPRLDEPADPLEHPSRS